jgi:hypothetical protein
MLSGPNSAASDLLAGAHARSGGDVDEAAAAKLAKHRGRVDGREVNALHVDRIAAVEFVFAHVESRAVAVCPAGVVDHHIEAAKLLHGHLHQGLNLIGLRDVGRHKDGLATCGHDLGCDFLPQCGLDAAWRCLHRCHHPSR